MTSRRWLGYALGAIVAAGAGCTGDNTSADDQGSASIAITQAPVDVTCVRLTIIGSRTVERRLDVVPGQVTVFTLTGLPLGMDTFTADAFSVLCNALDPMSIPTWVADPVQANVVSGTPADVTLSLHRNG